jgi:hypothetical protein
MKPIVLLYLTILLSLTACPQAKPVPITALLLIDASGSAVNRPGNYLGVSVNTAYQLSQALIPDVDTLIVSRVCKKVLTVFKGSRFNGLREALQNRFVGTARKQDSCQGKGESSLSIALNKAADVAKFSTQPVGVFFFTDGVPNEPGSWDAIKGAAIRLAKFKKLQVLAVGGLNVEGGYRDRFVEVLGPVKNKLLDASLEELPNAQQRFLELIKRN